MLNKNPKLYFNSSKEDDKAIKEIIDAKVECDFFGPISEERTPLLIDNSIKYYGIKGIRDYLEKKLNNSQ